LGDSPQIQRQVELKSRFLLPACQRAFFMATNNRT
jgi:hypothetical protein